MRTSATSENLPAPGTAWNRSHRILYIAGCGRSGSTLLDRILGQIDGVVSIGESVHLWRRGVLGNQLCGCGRPFLSCPFWVEVGKRAFGGWEALDVEAVIRLQRATDRNRFIPTMIVPVSPAHDRSRRRYSAILERLYGAIAATSGASVIVDSSKHASTAFVLRSLSTVDLRVVHLVRDPRGVCYSWTKEVRKPEVTGRVEHMPRYHPIRMAVRWNAHNALIHLLRSVGTPTLSVRYEALVQHPVAELGRILEFAELVSDLSFLGEGTVWLEPTHSVAGNPARFRSGAVPVRLDAEWTQRMSPLHRRAVTCLTWPLMRRYGYASAEGAVG
jgi:hypothetical protein